MKKLLFLCVMALFAGVVRAQNLQDVIHLKNGSIIRGTIIEQVPGESLKIETRDGNVFVYKMDEIIKMTREAGLSQWQARRQFYGRSNGFQDKPRGYAGALEAGYGIGVSGYGGRFEFDVVNGYRFNPYFYSGFGIGVNVWTNGSRIVTLPLFFHLRANFMDRLVSPYFSLNAGYNLSVTSDITGGFMVEPTLGVAFRTSNRTAVTFGIGYSGQQYKEKYLSRDYYYDSRYQSFRYRYYTDTIKYWASAIRIKVGVTF